MQSKVRLVRSFTGYIYVEGSCDILIKLLTHLRDKYGRNTADVNDALRILNNFEAFYEIMRRKFKDFISPKKDERDLIKGVVTIDKLKLLKKDGMNYVVLVLDKKVELNFISKVLSDLGIEFMVITE
jgi:hypothetical protein